jgi:outer membrane protein OmpA-like peptidoglycan-associated protein
MRVRFAPPLPAGLLAAAFAFAGPLMTVSAFAAPADEARPAEEKKPTEAVERHLSSEQPFKPWSQSPDQGGQRGDQVETRQVPVKKAETVKLRNVVPPIHFESGVARIPPDYTEKIARVLESMRYRRNVRVHFVGHADSQRLSPELTRQFGDNLGLSRERAGEVAEYFKKTLRLPPEAITYEWVGEAQPVASNDTEEGRALNRRVEVEVWYDEIRDAVEEQEVVVSDDIKRVKVCRMETVCKMRYKEGMERRARVKNLVAPLRYQDETTPISDDFTRQVKQALANLGDRQGVKVRFIGYTDDARLSARDERIYGDHLALSKARARRVALAMQETLKLPSSAIESDGRGAAQPAAANDTEQGRALNRRVEVEFWYDDPLQELSDEPQLCPGETGEEVLTKVYDPPWGPLANLVIENGQPVVPAGYAGDLHRALSDIAGRTNPRLRFIGYTKNERLDRRTASVYSDDVGLSASRARRAKDLALQDPALAGAHAEHEGRGYVQSDDVVNGGFLQGETSFVRVQAVYDEQAPLDDYEGVDIKRINREIQPKSPYDLNVMRITVDGKPIDDPNRSSSDIQRCTDVALDAARIRFHFDDLESRPRLGISAHPVAVSVNDAVRFRAYSNYASFIDHAEIRLFAQSQSLQAEPLEIIKIDDAGLAEWRPAGQSLAEAVRELKYVLRAYDAKGHYDETEAQPLWLYREPWPRDEATSGGPQPAEGAVAAPSDASQPTPAAAPADGSQGAAAAVSAPDASAPATIAPPPELLASYGESDLARHQIPMEGGAMRVEGSGVPSGHTVWVAGRQVPVDPQGNFVAEEILPAGAHTVEVAVLDDTGSGSLYLRDLEFKRKDLFYVGVADITVSENRGNGPVDLVQGENPLQPWDSSLDGRLAFYLNGKISDEWRLTTSADTREGPVEDLFSNFLDKHPESLFRRIDPDYSYPTFGDDSVVEEMAPTLGKFYLRATHGDDYGMFGNFKVGYLDNELAHVDRGLYGASARYGSEATTRFGDQRAVVEGYGAQPGTVPSYEEFRGTGGSLYYLRHQDILTGSERVRIEMRDKDSGIVTGVVNLRPVTDYDIDWIQGRVMLTDPLSSTADDNQLVRSSGLSGDEAWLVVRYEYTPGFDDLDAMSTGGQGHYWFGDHVRLGLTANSNEEGDVDSNLGAADLTWRMNADSFVKVQGGHSEGLVSGTTRSDDGGFGFQSTDPVPFTDAESDAYRADLSLGFGDLSSGRRGRFTAYAQNRDAGYSAPGQATIKDTEQYGGTFRWPVTNRLSLGAKGDQRTEELGLETRALEMDVHVKLNEHWSFSTGVRNDQREDHSPLPLVPLTQEQGERTDAVAQVTFDQGISWRAYGFVQDTVASDETREDNGRVGIGGSYRPTQRFRLDAEASDGDLGPGGKLGTTFLYSDRTNLYMNYALENERTDNGLRVRRGNLVSGAKRRLSDSSSVYLEERYQTGGTMSGLTHATGINLVAHERWNFGASAEVGTLRDQQTAAETDRKAGGVRLAYGADTIQFSTAVEYRRDEAEQADLTQTERTAWLFRNTFSFQLTLDWRLLGKLNHSTSESSLGAFFDGRYTEGVIGYAYRPVNYDRLSALAKFTYFYNLPSSDQVGLANTPVEFIQKSHIASLDLTYDLTTDWSIGGKYALRQGQVSLDRQNPEFFENAARLMVLRVDWRFLPKWESLIEARSLDLPDIDQTRRGALAAVYRYFGKHFKAGVGYNFSDFSDDLTDLSYDHQGAFINLIGAM